MTPNTLKERQTLGNFTALKNLNVTIQKGEFVCIIGDVGSGKSSLLSALIGDLLHMNSAIF
jgi:ABC-type lipoprotein export system ATPase subunit